MKHKVRQYIRKIISEQFSLLEESKKGSKFLEKLRDFLAKDGTLEYYGSELTKLNGWPDVPDSDGDSMGRLDLENCELISVDNKKFILVTGGDWQDGHKVELGLKGGKIDVANWKHMERGDYKKFTRMKSCEILAKIYESHEFHKDEESYLNYVKQILEDKARPSKNYDEHDKCMDEPSRMEGAIVEENSVSVVWNSPGHKQKSIKKKEDDLKNHEEYVERRFADIIKSHALFGCKGKVKIGNKERKIGYKVEFPGDDLIKYTIWIKKIK